MPPVPSQPSTGTNPASPKTFNVVVIYSGSAQAHQNLYYNNVPLADMVAMENALFSLGPALNANPPPKQPETQPRIPTLMLTAQAIEVSKDGQGHPQAKPFFGPITIPWHDIPAYGVSYIWNMVSQALAPFAKYLAKTTPVFLLALALLLFTGSAYADTSVQTDYSAAYALALKQHQPLVVYIATPPQPVPGAIVVGVDRLAGFTSAVVVSVPDGSGGFVVAHEYQTVPATGVSVLVQGRVPRGGVRVTTPGVSVRVGGGGGRLSRGGCAGGCCR